MNTEIRSVRLKGECAVCVTLRDGTQESMEKLYARAKTFCESSFKTEIFEKAPFKKVTITFKEPSEAKSMFTYLSDLLMVS